MEELVPVFKNSLMDNPVSIGSDIIEVGIDSVLNDGVLREVPIVSTIIGLGKTAANIHDRNLIRQTVAFINEFNSGKICNDSFQKYKKKLENPKFAEVELGRVLITLNRNIDIIKSKYEARFYLAYVNNEILWNEFCELCDITDRMYISDIDLLQDAYNKGGVGIHSSVSYRHERMISIGLLTNEARLNGSIIMENLDSDEEEILMSFTEIGIIFCRYAFGDLPQKL